MVRLLNAVFDVLNGTCISESIKSFNYSEKLKILNQMLDALNKSERVFLDEGLTPFISEDFYEDAITELKSNKGRLKYATPKMFQVFHYVELAFRKQSNENGVHNFMRDGLEMVIDGFSEAELPNICSDNHRQELLTTLVLEYLTIRCHFEVKRLKKLEKGAEKGKSLRKIAKVVG